MKRLHSLGQSDYTAWAVTTSAGIIVIDPLFEHSVENEVVNGLTRSLRGWQCHILRYLTMVRECAQAGLATTR